MTPRNEFENKLRAAVQQAVRDGCAALRESGDTGRLTLELWTGSPLPAELRVRLNDIAARGADAQKRKADPVAFKRTTADIAFRIVGPGRTVEERWPAHHEPEQAAPADARMHTEATRLLPRRQGGGGREPVGGFLLCLSWNELVSQHSLLPDRTWRRFGRTSSRQARPPGAVDARPVRVPSALTPLPSGWLLELCVTDEAVLLRRTSDRHECAVELDRSELPYGRPHRLAPRGELRFTTSKGSTRLEYLLTRPGTPS